MVYARLCRRLIFLACILSSLRADAFPVGITYVQNAVAKGAVCLDGSPPAYHLDRGSGSGINNWLVHIEGGGWCNNVTTCLARKDNRLGSSKKMVTELAFSGILSNKQQFNPDFYSWNRVKVRYCDGSSFTGDVEAVDPATGLYFRGARVWLAVIEDLLAKGLKSAENALLSGCSAGGLTSILHCDSFRALVPMSAKVKCLSDAGYFINTKDVSGTQHIQAFYDDVVNVHGSAKNLPVSCTSQMKPSMCFFPQYMAQQIRTPLFILNAAYDSWQIKNILAPGVADPHGTWHSCKLDIKQCSSSQLETMQGIFAAPGYPVKQPIALKARAVRGWFPFGVFKCPDRTWDLLLKRHVHKLMLRPLPIRDAGDMVKRRLSRARQHDNRKGSWRLVFRPESLPEDRLPLPL